LTETISLEYIDKVAVVRLNREVINALNLDLIEELTESLRTVKQADDTSGLVLTSSNNKFFCIGFDIPQLYGLDREDFVVFYRSFNALCLDLYTLPMPTVAALTGHATAGGCILALGCDERFVAEGRKMMGLNEIKLGVPVPYAAACFLISLIGDRYARQVMEIGEFYLPEDAHAMGLVDRILPQELVITQAVEHVQTVGSTSREAFALIKGNRVEPVVAQIQAHRDEKERMFLDCWFSAAARKQLKEAMEKF